MKPYPHYKHTSVVWLGEIPDQWKTAPIKHIVETPVTDGPHETPQFLSSGVPFISAEAIKNNRIDFSKKRGYISTEDHEKYSRKYKPQKGDIYLVKSGATTGSVAKVETEMDFNIWSPLAVIRPNKREALTDFVFYFMQSENFYQAIESGWSFGTQQNIGMGVIQDISISVPPLVEQEVISRYLDHKTAELDDIIAKKQRLIKLLQEERAAVINMAVTQGLDPDAPRKPSGIPWLDDIPAHWGKLPLKRISEKITDGEHISPSFTLEGVPFLSAKDIRDRRINLNVSKFVSYKDGAKFRQRCNPEEGDILIVSRGATIGRIGLVETTDEFCLLGSVILVKPRKKIAHSTFLYYLLNHLHIQEELLLTSQSSAQQAIYLISVSELMLLCPPLREQKEIAEFLDRKTAQFEQTIAQTEEQIDLLKEYRTTLISQAVTGKIDVRQEVAS